MSYQPSPLILKRYADVLVNFALNSGHGVKKGEVVMCAVPDVAKALALELQNTLLRSGAHPIIKLLPTGFDADFYTLAESDQLTFFPEAYLREQAALIDHQISIIADPNPWELSQVSPAKIIAARDAKKVYRDLLNHKENQGKFTWTAALWGMEAKAEEVGLSLEAYWQQIIKACFLDEADPVAHWKELFLQQHEIRTKMDSLSIEYVHIQGEDADLKIRLGAERAWMMGGGRNVPSFECFTSPDWRGTEGWIRFNQPLYRYGNVIKGIYLKFEKGLVVEAQAESGLAFLQQMLKSPNANRLGEFSLTDKRMSRIDHTMAETLFDENIGGPFGNMHVALGMAFKDCYRGNQAEVPTEKWNEMGYNDAAEHSDIISTADRTVTAYLTDGTSKVIYADGMFKLD